MKTKLRDKLVTVQVTVSLLVYSLDKLTTKDAHEGDVIEIPQWMVEGLVSEDRVTTDVTVEIEEEEDAGDGGDSGTGGSDSGGDGDGDDPLTITELKGLTELDFEDLKSTADCITWAEEQVPLADLTIHPACKLDTSIGKILEACAALTED
jgi:hypothetical protein